MKKRPQPESKLLKGLDAVARHNRPEDWAKIRAEVEMLIAADVATSGGASSQPSDRISEKVEDPPEVTRCVLASLDLRTQARCDWSIEQLRARNTQAREPLVKHLEGRIWEVRRESNTNIFRLLYAFLPGRRILFLHGFQKKTQKIPRREIAIAQTGLTRFLATEGGE